MIKIKTSGDNGSSERSIGHTITSNLIPTENDFDLTSLYFNYMLSGKLAYTGTGSAEYPPNQMMANIFNRPVAPFDYGSIVLRNSKHKREIDILSYIASGDRGKATSDIVGIADMRYNLVSTNDEVLGLLNTAESSTTFKKGGSELNIKRVFDFPTNAVNNEFDEILIMPTTFNYGATVVYPNDCDYSNASLSTHCYIKKPIITSEDRSANISYPPRYTVNGNDEMMVIYNDGTILFSRNGISAEVNYLNSTKSNHTYSTPAFINGKFIIVGNSPGGTSLSATGTGSYYTVEDITYNAETDKYDATVSSVNKFPAFTSTIVGGTYYIHLVFEWDGYVYMVTSRSSTSSTYGTNIIKLNLDMDTKIDSLPSARTDIFNLTGTQYHPTHMIYDPVRNTVILGRSTCKLIELDKDLNITIHSYNTPYGLSKINRFIDNDKIFALLDPYAPLDGASTGSFMCFSEVTSGYNSIMSIKLNSPVEKLPTETLKLTLDLTFKNGNVSV